MPVYNANYYPVRLRTLTCPPAELLARWLSAGPMGSAGASLCCSATSVSSRVHVCTCFALGSKVEDVFEQRVSVLFCISQHIDKLECAWLFCPGTPGPCHVTRVERGAVGLQAKVYGKMQVLFLDVEAGSDELHGMTVDARTRGQVCARSSLRSPSHTCRVPSSKGWKYRADVQELHFCMDASGVPVEYGLTIIQICMLYPRKLMFICKADLTVDTWLAEYKLPTIDTYFMVECYDQDIPMEPHHVSCGNTSTEASCKLQM
jgi:hypothetical protein